jgi:hypothetical protein
MDMLNYSINYTILTFIINEEGAFSNNVITYITFKKASHKIYLIN